MDVGEKLKIYSEKSIAATHQFMRQLTEAKDFQDVLRIQTEFMQTLMSASAEQTKGATEAFAKAASNVLDREELKPPHSSPMV
jgi:hypothetical protein